MFSVRNYHLLRMLHAEKCSERGKKTLKYFFFVMLQPYLQKSKKGDTDSICLRHILYIYKPEKDTFE